MRYYKPLKNNIFSFGDYSLVPLRDEDKYLILDWRNSQIDILRQDKLLTKNTQENYFKTIISQLFEVDKPLQLLWSFLFKDKLIGYGGLVHIDWEKKTAEISFLTETSRSKIKDLFISEWSIYLSLVKEIANVYLNFNYIFTYAYDIRPNLYIALENSGFNETERIKDFIEINNELKDVVIHTFYFNEPIMRFAKLSDVDLYYKWVNNSEVRKNSFNQDVIKYENHINWFTAKINSENCFFYLFFNKDLTPIGQVRIDKNEETVIDVSIDENQRGKLYSPKILKMACEDFLKKSPKATIYSYIKKSNISSYKAFLKAGFIDVINHNDLSVFKLEMLMNKRQIRYSFVNNNDLFDVIKLNNTDEKEVAEFFELFYHCFGKRSYLVADWYNWFYVNNPYGLCNNYILVDREKNKFVGAYALAKSVISINGKSSDAKIGVNGMIHQDYRNRGLYSKIIEIAVQQDDKEVLAIAYPHGTNKGSASGHAKAGWKLLKEIAFYATTSLNDFSIDEKVKKISSFTGINGIDELVKLSNYSSYIARTKEWLNWRFFLRPHKKYEVIGYFDSANNIQGYLVLGYYKNDIVNRCQILDYNSLNFEILLSLLNNAKQIALTNQCSVLDLWLDEYSKELMFFEEQAFFKTDEHYSLFYFNNTNNKLDINIKTILSDLDAV